VALIKASLLKQEIAMERIALGLDLQGLRSSPVPKLSWLRRKMPDHPERGAAALEYILVSTFAAVVTISALGFVSKIIKEELATMASKLGSNEQPDISNPFAP
jgi:Flp pilus assembly pilin Flp